MPSSCQTAGSSSVPRLCRARSGSKQFSKGFQQMTKVATSRERVNQKRQLKCNSYIGFLFNYLHAENFFFFSSSDDFFLQN